MKLSCVRPRGWRGARKGELVFHRSERLFLRPAFPEDSGAILAGIGEEAIVRNLARAPWPYGIEDARAFAALPQNPRLPHFLVTLPGVGVIGAAGMGEHEGEPELGYWIARPHWSKGYGGEALARVVRYASEECTPGFTRLSARVAPDNTASRRMLVRLGFAENGVSVDNGVERLRYER